MGELSQEYSRGAVVGMGVVLLALTGAVLGAGVALILDAVLRRKARTVEVTGHYEEQGGPEADAAEGSRAAQAEEEEADGTSLETSPEEQRDQTAAEQTRADREG